MRIPRSRGAVSGVLLIIAGLWGGLVPFVGHYFNFVIGPDKAWDFTDGRLLLSVLPAVAVVLGGLVLTSTAHRVSAGTGAWLALAGGVWFVVGQSLSILWNDGTSQAGRALGSDGHRVAEELAYFYGLGALITALAAFALGRIAVRSVRDAELEREAELAGTTGVATRDRAVVRNRHPDGVDEPATTTTAADRVAAASDEPARRRGLFRRG